MSQATVTTDHDAIRRWAEERQGRPAIVRTSQGFGGVLRFDFGEDDQSLEEVQWDEFFRVFDENRLALLHQEETATGQQSRFFKFVERNGNRGELDMTSTEDQEMDRPSASLLEGQTDRRGTSRRESEGSSRTSSMSEEDSSSSGNEDQAPKAARRSRTASKRASGKRASTKRAVTGSAAKRSATRTTKRGAAAKKSSGRKTSSGRTADTRSGARKTTARKSTARKTSAKKTAAKRSTTSRRSSGSSSRGRATKRTSRRSR